MLRKSSNIYRLYICKITNDDVSISLLWSLVDLALHSVVAVISESETSSSKLLMFDDL
jgi:hypothetical protein